MNTTTLHLKNTRNKQWVYTASVVNADGDKLGFATGCGYDKNGHAMSEALRGLYCASQECMDSYSVERMVEALGGTIQATGNKWGTTHIVTMPALTDIEAMTRWAEFLESTGCNVASAAKQRERISKLRVLRSQVAQQLLAAKAEGVAAAKARRSALVCPYRYITERAAYDAWHEGYSAHVDNSNAIGAQLGNAQELTHSAC